MRTRVLGSVSAIALISTMLLGQTPPARTAPAAPSIRPLSVDDVAKQREVRDPQVSPDGKWIAYTVGTIDVGGEQMYQALNSMGVDTQLVIYPGQFHGITTPSYYRDRLKRYLAWYNKYLTAKGL